MPSKKIKVIRPNPGSQSHFVSCPYYEALYHGTRGPGKTYALLLSFLQDVGKGYGEDYQGIVFRRKYKELKNIFFECNKLFRRIYGKKVEFKKSSSEYIFPGGETLTLAYAMYERDYWNFHGDSKPFLAMDELTNWPTPELFRNLKSICRTSNPRIKTRVRLTTNSLGPGHSWVKDYFQIDQVPTGKPIRNEFGNVRVNYFGAMKENPYIMRDENYRIYLLSISDPNIRKSWLQGRWDVIAGGAVSDLWRTERHIVENFKAVPPGWKVYRVLDWGSAKPYCVLYIAVSNGDPWKNLSKPSGQVQTVKGDCYVIGEIYGWSGEPNKGTRETPGAVSRKMLKYEAKLKEKLGIKKILPGPADSAIYSKERGEKESSIADLFKPLLFVPSIKGPGSRILGLETVRDRLEGAIPDKEGYREFPGVFFCQNATHTIRTLPVLPRDENDLEDVDTDSEDHSYDGIRYFLTSPFAGKTTFRVLKP